MFKFADQMNIQYDTLLRDLSTLKLTIEKGLNKKVNTILVEGYWTMGQRICQEKAFQQGISSQNGPVLKRLSAGLNMEYSLLTRIVKFYRTWPQKCPHETHPDLSWSHFKAVMAVSDKDQKRFYLKQAQKEQWNKLDLSRRIKARYFEARQTVADQAKTGRKTAGKARAKTGQKLDRLKPYLYHYAGEVIRVVDGDTLLLDVDLGFNVSFEVRVRLRGVNTQEMDSEDTDKRLLAEKAKAFVQGLFEEKELIVVQTYKVDLYGRFVADIFYLPGETDKEKIYSHGIFLNQQLVDEGLAVMVG